MRVEAVYYRHHTAYKQQFDSVEDALSFIEFGEDEGSLFSVGVFMDGEPHIYGGFVTKDTPTEEQAAEMKEVYAESQDV